ncbi:MAG: glucokinase [Rhodospirillales bacterium]|nr:glucokinase [Rhodospirillales bacterium]
MPAKPKKPDDKSSVPAVAEHGASVLPAVSVDSYNVEIKDAEGFIGDRTTNGAFRDILDDWRKRLKKVDDDPLGEKPSEDLSKKELDKFLNSDDPEVAGMMHEAVGEFAQELSGVIRRFLKLKDWKDTERIVIGGGFRRSQIGEQVIGRTSILLKAEGIDIQLTPISHHTDEAALIGAVHLAPSWIFAGHDGILAVDIGGTNIRAGIVEFNRKTDPNLAKTRVKDVDLWRHADDAPNREAAVEKLIAMLRKLARAAEKEQYHLAPFIGIACPGIINADGTIKRGGQNLPGNWEGAKFNLPQRIAEAVSIDDKHPTAVVMHNDAVVQGLCEVPSMRDVEHWGVLTIGTGLGNARFTNRE